MWNEAPSYEDVVSTLRRRASLLGEIRIIELLIQILEAEITVEKPRNTAVRIIGYDEDTSVRMRSYRSQLVDKKNELDVVEAEMKLHDYRKDMFKTLTYRERL